MLNGYVHFQATTKQTLLLTLVEVLMRLGRRTPFPILQKSYLIPDEIFHELSLPR